jgi:hypothetical protein
MVGVALRWWFRPVAGRLERYGNRLGNLHRIRIKRTAGVKLPFNPKKSASLPKTIKAHLLIAELQAEARRERFAESFDQHFADDDVPSVPNPMDNPQARRAQGVAL